MRKLSATFLSSLRSGHLSPLTKSVHQDHDLDLQIRDNYLNIYYKGNSLLKLTEINPNKYRVKIDPKFTQGMEISALNDERAVKEFLRQVPAIKENILIYGKSSIEIEYEQMIVRANNYELRNNSEYFIIDRQYTVAEVGRFDLMGIYWPRNQRRKRQEVGLCFIEIKFALNKDIRDVHKQLGRYYQAIQSRAASLAEEAEIVLMQKLELGLFNQPANRLEAMKTLTISRKLDDFQFILACIDLNPYSGLLNVDSLASLPFANQVKIFYSGFAMWAQKLYTPGDSVL